MSKKMSKRRLRIQLAFVYSIMVCAVVAIVAVLVLVLQGYRYNSYDGKLEQGGLVQFDSRPDGASVTVDNTLLANKTASKIVLTAGDHTITMNRQGYNPWKKDVTVKPGSILWLNYALLFPTNPKSTQVATFPAVTSALAAPNQRTMAMISRANSPVITLATLNDATPAVSTVELPATSYTPPAEGAEHAFTLLQWDKNSHLLLVKHTVNDTDEYLSVDTRDASRTINITAALGVAIQSAMYAQNDASILYILNKAGELRRVDTSSTTISGPLASNVSSFRVTEPSIVVYETKADENGQRIVGYVSSDSTKAKIISSYTDMNGGALLATTGTYYGDHYVAVLHGTTLDIMQGNLMSSNSNTVPALRMAAEIKAPAGVKYIGFSPNDQRMVYIATEDAAMVYDLELNKSHTIPLANKLTRDLTWIDGYHIATTGSNSYYHDFDGSNSQQFAADGVNMPATLDSSSKYLYFFSTSGDGVALKRINLRSV